MLQGCVDNYFKAISYDNEGISKFNISSQRVIWFLYPRGERKGWRGSVNRNQNQNQSTLSVENKWPTMQESCHYCWAFYMLCLFKNMKALRPSDMAREEIWGILRVLTFYLGTGTGHCPPEREEPDINILKILLMNMICSFYSQVWRLKSKIGQDDHSSVTDIIWQMKVSSTMC